jgi:uroporphyrinogen-III synthase
MPALVVTRPQPDAALWVQQLQAQGIAATALPMMAIGPSRSPAAVAAMQAAFQKLDSYRALMFVSGNAVRYFFAQLHALAMPLPLQAQYWSPGPGTSKALLDEGISPSALIQPALDAPQFDSESLWEQAQHQIYPSDTVLIVRGGDGQQARGHGRQWLTEQLHLRGAQVDFAPVYERQPPATTPALLQSIEELRAEGAAWLFSSSECVQHLVQCNPAWSWHTHTAIATHPRIARQAQQAGFGNVIATMPTLPSITASLKSLHDIS